MQNLGIYIHIPFCKRKCYYCDFISYCDIDEKYIDEYIICLKDELDFKSLELKKYEKNNNEKYVIDTIYIGGGTPSFIYGKHIYDIICKIKQYFNLDKDCEITIEVNPDSVTDEKLEFYKKAGINRISIGLQTNKNDLLKKIGRIHDVEKFDDAYKNIRKYGFDNINIDLMIGLPDQCIKDVLDSLEYVISLNPTHVSVYSLILEEKTKLFDYIKNNELNLPDDDIERKMYWSVKDKLEQNGYLHYEISNFSKVDKQSKHNLNCWKQKEYLGFGVAAHSFLGNTRFSNTIDIKKYIKNIKNSDFLKIQNVEEILGVEEKQREFMILMLRTIPGLEIRLFKEKFGQNPLYLFKNEINKLVNDRLIEVDGDFIRLTKKGLDYANIVWQTFI